MFNLRGVHRFGPLEARLGDPFGLFPRRIRVAPENEVVVYPAIHALLHNVPQWSGNGVAEAHRGQPVDVPPDVSTIRDYAPTDGLSRIHWASTARTGHLISRTFDTGQSADLLIVLDLQRGVHAGTGIESSVEYAISLTASVVHGAIRRGQAVGLVTNTRGGTSSVQGVARCSASGSSTSSRSQPTMGPEAWRRRSAGTATAGADAAAWW